MRTLWILVFLVTDDLDRISDQVLSREPGLDVVSSHPGRKVAKENGVTHSVVRATPLRWDYSRGIPRGALLC